MTQAGAVAELPSSAELPASADLVVVGAGLMGAMTALAATRRGLSVVLLEQHEMGHALGSSHGSARIVRRAYADPLYARLTGEAFERWRDLEAETGTPVIRMTGGIDSGAARDVAGIAGILAHLGVAHELLDAASAQARWPGMLFEGPVLHHPQAGTVDAAAAVEAAVRCAVERGAHVAARTAVRSLRLEGDEAVVVSGAGEVRAPAVVLAAGAWLGPLWESSGTAVALPPLRVTQQQIFHFPRRAGVPEWPVEVRKDTLSTYSLPGGRDGGPGAGRKVAEHLAHSPGGAITAQTRDGAVDPAARQRLVEHVARWLPGLVAEPFAESTCLYTTTPSEDFVLDRVGPLVVVSPCSGHGAKFAPVVGERAVDLVVGGKPEPRFALAAHMRTSDRHISATGRSVHSG